MRPLIAALALSGSIFFGFQSTALALESETTNSMSASEFQNSVQGNWSFETTLYRGDSCQMWGTLTVFPSSDQGASNMDCALKAIEMCDGERSIVEQSCQISLSNDVVVIDSEIENFLEWKAWSSGYAPDNFELTEVSPTKMTGLLVSAVSAPAVFYRSEGGIS